MKAKFIYEAFSEKGDPIEDMGIGGHTFNALKPGALIKLKPEYRSLVALTQNHSGQFTDRSGMQIRHNHCLMVTSIIPNMDGIKEIHFKRFFADEDAINAKNEWQKTGKPGRYGSSNRMKVSKLQFDRRFNVIERGFDKMKESLNEKFKETSDPIADMGIGDKGLIIKQALEKLAIKNKFESRSLPEFVEKDGLEEWGYENVKFLRSWYKEGEENFREITLFSFIDKTGKTKYGIYECDEEAESGGDEITWPDSMEFTNDYWKKEIY